MKKKPRNLLALSSFGFSIAHFCFSLMWMTKGRAQILPWIEERTFNVRAPLTRDEKAILRNIPRECWQRLEDLLSASQEVFQRAVRQSLEVDLEQHVVELMQIFPRMVDLLTLPTS